MAPTWAVLLTTLPVCPRARDPNRTPSCPLPGLWALDGLCPGPGACMGVAIAVSLLLPSSAERT